MNENFKGYIICIIRYCYYISFLWAVYEFYIKKRFKIKASTFPSPPNKMKEYISLLLNYQFI